MSEPVPAPSAAIASLMQVRADLLARIVALDEERSKLLKQVRTLDASMRVVQPGIKIERPQRCWQKEETKPDALAEVAKSVLRTMRQNGKPMTVPEIVATLMAARGIEETDRAYREALRQRVGLYLRKSATKDEPVLRRTEGSDSRLPTWEVVPLEEMRARLTDAR